MRQEATNSFIEGLNMDLNPLTTPNNVLTDNLNGTIITYNGNEFVLQNDQGNYKLKHCKLPNGFIPVGIKGYGDILYIVSFNPLTNETEIGSYPSPRRIFGTTDRDQECNPRAIVTGKYDIPNEIETPDKFTYPKWPEWPNTKGQRGDNNLESDYNKYAKYRELIQRADLQIFTLSDDNDNYKLNFNDEFKLEVDDNGAPNFDYQTLQYYILDENKKLHDLYIPDKYINSFKFNKVFWETPGWLTTKYRLADLFSVDFNIRSIGVDRLDIDSNNVIINELESESSDFNIQIVSRDKLFNDNEDTNTELQIRIQFAIKKDEDDTIIYECIREKNDLSNKNIAKYYISDKLLSYSYDNWNKRYYYNFTIKDTIAGTHSDIIDPDIAWKITGDDTLLINVAPVVIWKGVGQHGDDPMNEIEVNYVLDQFEVTYSYKISELLWSHAVEVAQKQYQWRVYQDKVLITFSTYLGRALRGVELGYKIFNVSGNQVFPPLESGYDINNDPNDPNDPAFEEWTTVPNVSLVGNNTIDISFTNIDPLSDHNEFKKESIYFIVFQLKQLNIVVKQICKILITSEVFNDVSSNILGNLQDRNNPYYGYFSFIQRYPNFDQIPTNEWLLRFNYFLKVSGSLSDLITTPPITHDEVDKHDNWPDSGNEYSWLYIPSVNPNNLKLPEYSLNYDYKLSYTYTREVSKLIGDLWYFLKDSNYIGGNLIINNELKDQDTDLNINQTYIQSHTFGIYINYKIESFLDQFNIELGFKRQLSNLFGNLSQVPATLFGFMTMKPDTTQAQYYHIQYTYNTLNYFDRIQDSGLNVSNSIYPIGWMDTGYGAYDLKNPYGLWTWAVDRFSRGPIQILALANIHTNKQIYNACYGFGSNPRGGTNFMNLNYYHQFLLIRSDKATEPLPWGDLKQAIIIPFWKVSDNSPTYNYNNIAANEDVRLSLTWLFERIFSISQRSNPLGQFVSPKRLNINNDVIRNESLRLSNNKLFWFCTNPFFSSASIKYGLFDYSSLSDLTNKLITVENQIKNKLTPDRFDESKKINFTPMNIDRTFSRTINLDDMNFNVNLWNSNMINIFQPLIDKNNKIIGISTDLHMNTVYGQYNLCKTRNDFIANGVSTTGGNKIYLDKTMRTFTDLQGNIRQFNESDIDTWMKLAENFVNHLTNTNSQGLSTFTRYNYNSTTTYQRCRTWTFDMNDPSELVGLFEDFGITPGDSANLVGVPTFF